MDLHTFSLETDANPHNNEPLMTKIILHLLSFAILFSGCTSFYGLNENTKKTRYNGAKKDDWTRIEERNHVVVHFNDSLYEITAIKQDTSTGEISAYFAPFTGRVYYYYDKVLDDNDGVSIRKSKDDKSIVRQVHLFVKNLEFDDDGLKLHFNLNEITRVDLSSQAVGANILMGLLIGVTATAATSAAILFILCNCPRMYVHNGQDWVLSNSLFTGAKAPQLERYDYKPIPDFFSTSSDLKMEIRNEQQELEYINELGLLAILHPDNTEIAADRNGKLYSYNEASALAPTLAQDASGNNLLLNVKQKDDYAYQFNPDEMVDLAELNLSFELGTIPKDAKMILHLKNSHWAGAVYNEFNGLFGKAYSKWVAKNKDKPKEAREAWMRQEGIKLLVEQKTASGWKLIDEVELVGEIAYNTVIIPLDSIKTTSPQFRLRSGFMFWELDYAALDTSVNEIIHYQEIAPFSASKPDGTQYLDLILHNDAAYLPLEMEDPILTIAFKGLPLVQVGEKRTLVLKSKGFYTSTTTYTGKVQRKELQKFKNPGELSRYSKRLYDQYSHQVRSN